MNKRPTIRDVAALAGVSVATVSRVLSGDYPVAGNTRTKVQRAVRELDYVVNAHARALSGATSNVVALVMYDVVTPFFAHIASGVEYQATESDRLCLVCTTHGDPDRELEIVKLMREQHADAVILVGGVLMNDDYRERMYRYAKGLEDAGSRLVLCGRPSLGPDFPAITVEYDNAGARTRPPATCCPPGTGASCCWAARSATPRSTPGSTVTGGRWRRSGCRWTRRWSYTTT
ncbi:LacI family DNA-binding transcriptional regulator [Catellatospora bangladeshensis]|uniref:LacI family DNA-binding transcriptional regulator n=1 Tax=Catellatospora bangladeshensis TaxID=310355 RepID=UPI0036060754